MAQSSSQVLNDIQASIGKLNPLLDGLPDAPKFFKEGINKAFQYGLPLLKEGANLEAGAYNLPGTLMDQYNQEFGGGFGGPSAMGRMNSILGRLGSQFSLVDLVSKLGERQGARIEDMAKSLTDQYGLGIEGIKTRIGMQMPIWQGLMQREESAANRAAMARARGGGGGGNPGPLQIPGVNTSVINQARTNPNNIVNGKVVSGPILPGGGFIAPKKPASSLINQYNILPKPSAPKQSSFGPTYNKLFGY